MLVMICPAPPFRRAELEALRVRDEEERRRVQVEMTQRREQEDADRRLAVSYPPHSSSHVGAPHIIFIPPTYM